MARTLDAVLGDDLAGRGHVTDVDGGRLLHRLDDAHLEHAWSCEVDHMRLRPGTHGVAGWDAWDAAWDARGCSLRVSRGLEERHTTRKAPPPKQ